MTIAIIKNYVMYQINRCNYINASTLQFLSYKLDGL